MPDSAAFDLDLWIACERDAVWTAKLAILRARRREDIAHFGACLREHERHAGELELLARADALVRLAALRRLRAGSREAAA